MKNTKTIGVHTPELTERIYKALRANNHKVTDHSWQNDVADSLQVDYTYLVFMTSQECNQFQVVTYIDMSEEELDWDGTKFLDTEIELLQMFGKVAVNKLTPLQKILKAISQEIINLKDDEYWGTDESEKNEYAILMAVKDEFDYDYEDDAKASEYFSKATQTEIWQYWLMNIIPSLHEQVKAA